MKIHVTVTGYNPLDAPRLETGSTYDFEVNAEDMNFVHAEDLARRWFTPVVRAIARQRDAVQAKMLAKS